MREEWKLFADGNYAVSNRGRVKRVTPGRRTKPGKLLTLNLMKIGYYRIAPVIDGRNVPMYVHQVVAEHFMGPCPQGRELNHIDGDKTNNHVTNLEYVTHRYNLVHAYSMGLIDQTSKCTVSDATVARIRKMRKAGHTYRVIGEATGVSQRHCRDIATYQARARV